MKDSYIIFTAKILQVLKLLFTKLRNINKAIAFAFRSLKKIISNLILSKLLNK